MLTVLQNWFSLGRNANHKANRRPIIRLNLEELENRSVPALSVTVANANTLVQTLVGTGVTTSNATLLAGPSSAGTFSGGGDIIGFDSGVVLDTGSITTLPGPNTSDSTSGDASGQGDPDLDKLVAPNTTDDATVLQFDFVPQGQTVSFNYVFGSEEYNEFVGSEFNDVFGFFVNGQNIALVPGTTTPVSINTINLDTNSQYYRNNDLASGAPINTELDGLTTVLTATANVNPGVVNHIKLAISDVSDTILDSAVFLQAGSFSSPPVPAFTSYFPFRYAFRDLTLPSVTSDLSQAATTQASNGVTTELTTKLFEGNLTIVNTGNGTATGPLTVSFSNLPKGVTIVNATGVDPTSKLSYISVPISQLPPGSVVRVPIKLSNPLNQPLSTFFLSEYSVNVSQAM